MDRREPTHQEVLDRAKQVCAESWRLFEQSRQLREQLGRLPLIPPYDFDDRPQAQPRRR